MNPLDWEALQRLQRNQNHQLAVNNNSRGPSPWTKNPGSSYRYPVEEAHSSVGSDVGLPGPAFNNLHRVGTESEDPDGEPLEEDDDPELARKRQELSEIQDRILHKRVSIALRTVEELETPDSNQATTRKRLTLRGRVNEILKLRRSLGLSKHPRAQPSGLSGDVARVEDHPLKVRVKALMKRRHIALPSNSQIHDGPCAPLPPGPTVTTLAQEDTVNQGFQRFLTLLNKGIDLDLLSRIVNDDSDELPPGDALLKRNPPSVMPCGDTQRCTSGAHQREDSGERKARPASREPATTDGKSPSHDEARTDDSGNCSLVSSCRSKSPSAVEKKRRTAEVEKPKLGDQHQQLQNILSTLGLSLGAEEMSRLTDRTQERLYGKREGRATAEQETPTMTASHRHHRSSSSSSDSSSSSCSSSSSSPSQSPSRGQNSQELGAKSKRSRSGDKIGDVQMSQGNQGVGRAEGHAEGHAEGEGTNFGENFAYQNQQLHPAAAAASSFPGYNLDSYATEHAVYVNGATHPYWTYPQGDTPASPGPSSYPYSQWADQHQPTSAYKRFNTDRRLYGDVNLLMNPDLSQSEGQSGSLYRTCCLLPVNSGKTSDRETTRKILTYSKKKKSKGKKGKNLKRKAWWSKIMSEKQKKKAAASRARPGASGTRLSGAGPGAGPGASGARPEALGARLSGAAPGASGPGAGPGASEAGLSGARPGASGTGLSGARPEALGARLSGAAPGASTGLSGAVPGASTGLSGARPGAMGAQPSEAEPPEKKQELMEKKQELTEEEIKANLRKKLEAFNQMARNKSQSQQKP